MEPTREIYWNISGGVLLYVFLAAALGALAYGIYRRARLWQLGVEMPRLDRIRERLQGLIVEVFGQRRPLRDRYSGVAHLLLFYGFLAMVVATGLISIQEWTGIHFLKGDFYLWYSLLSDGFGILAIVGLLMLLWRRAVERPARLHSVLDDWIVLGLLLLIFLQGFLVEGARIAVTELQQQPELARWSPGGHAVALLMQGLGADRLRSLHRLLWWFHAVTVFGFLGYMAFGKLNHLWYGPLNIFLRNLGPSGRLVHADIEEMAESDPDSIECLGIDSIDQYGRKDLLDLDACMNCGRCEEACPAHMSGVPLNPRKVIRDMGDHLRQVGPELLEARESDDGTAADLQPLFGEPDDGGPGPAVLEAEIWGCRTCGACQRECPVRIEHIPKLVGMRRHLVMTQSKMGELAQQFLKNMDDRMHPFAGAAHDREEWFQDLDVKLLGQGDQAEYLFWVGCAGAMVDRNIEVTRAVVKVLKAGGVDFAILGAEEVCTGDPARRAGGELTFQICAKTNIETFSGYGVQKIITACPHCFNTFENEYPDFGGHYEVTHHTQLIDGLIRSGRLRLAKKLDAVSYHDPCYLGRHNEVYDAPRAVLGQLSESGKVTEPASSRSRSLCCGSGGGYAWMDDEPEKRISHTRFEQLQACGAGTVAVSCPFCMQMFEDAASAIDPGRNVRPMDIAELVADALDE
jgi:Fe-S oxidoreductase/nitrate reductase gamma subunit